MAGIFRLSDAAVLAFHALAHIAQRNGEAVSTREVAEEYSASENHLKKVLRRLSLAGLAKAIRGPKGGFKLAKPPSKITLMRIFEAIEGRYNAVKCFADAARCPRKKCIFGGHIERISRELKLYLTKTTLADITE